LVIVTLLLPSGSLFSDDQLLKAEQELRKRHLFYREMTGQPSPALTRALAHYQKKKGFACTGRLDPDTCASLGIVKAPATTVQSPFVVADTGDLHDANGEVLPSFLVWSPPGTERAIPVSLATTDRRQIALSLAHTETALVSPQQRASNERSRARSPRTAPSKEKNPFVVALWSMDHAMKRWMGDAGPTKKKNVATKRL
jgi:hypothetical protein